MAEHATPRFLVAYFGGRDAINGHALEVLIGDVLKRPAPHSGARYAIRSGAIQRLADFGSKLTAWADDLKREQRHEQVEHGNQ